MMNERYVCVRASDVLHLLEVYIENGMVEDEDLEVIGRLHEAASPE